MLKLLFKKQLAELFRGYYYDTRKNAPRSKAKTVLLFALYFLLIFGVLGSYIGYMAYTLAEPFAENNVGWLYFCLFGLIAIVLGTFGSAFSTYSSLYLAKDNELLLSLPIKPGCIIASRLLGVYVIGTLYASAALLPAAIIYIVKTPFRLQVLLGSLIFVVMITLVVFMLSVLLGWAVARISRKIRNKAFVTVIASLAFVAVYYILYFKAQNALVGLLSNQELGTQAAEFGQKLKGTAYAVYLFGCVGVGDIKAVAVFAAAVCVLLYLIWRLLSRTFLSMAASASGVSGARRARGVSAQGSVRRALLKKEFARFASSANYMLNSGMGTLMLTAGGVALLIKGKSVAAAIADVFSFAPGADAVLLCAASVLLTSMNMSCAPSVSLEGKSIWIPRSLPLTGRQVLTAKLQMQLILTLPPAVFAAACALIALSPLGIFEAAAYFGACVSAVFLFALMGLVFGIKRVNLSWTNEVAVIKQGPAVTFTTLLSMLEGLVIAGLYIVSLLTGVPEQPVNAGVYLSGVCIINLALSFALYAWINKKGAAMFDEL
ncbi:MAG: hypothetical protein IKR85_09490 [Clostridia bacterium]|nr:hypothetical protein [Clostridia bacterium]